MRNSLWLVECLTKSPTEWDYQFAWVIASDADTSLELVKHHMPHFDKVLTTIKVDQLSPLKTASDEWLISFEFCTRIDPSRRRAVIRAIDNAAC